MKRILFLLIPVAFVVASCATHSKHAESHPHQHGPGCGHLAITHDGHTDYLDAGHLHHMHGSHVDEHTLAVSATNPDKCTPGFAAAEHATNHIHGPNCGHGAIAHGNHVDYLVDGHLHHLDGNHCDDHGLVTVAGN